MAILSSSSGNWMLSLKVLLISTGVLSMAVILKLSVPVILEFAISEIPLIWSFVLSWLRPPYLYLVINCIIITIVASSKLQHKVDEEPAVQVKIQGDVPTDYAVKAVYDDVVSKNPVEVRPEFGYGSDANAVKVSDFEVYGNGEARVSDVKDVSVVSNDGDDFAISRSSWTPQSKDSSEYSFSSEKPLVSMRFGHRKAVKASPEAGRALGVSKPKRHDTLETTWKTITDGRPMPLTRHLRKSDTWETHGRHSNVGPQVHQSPPQMMKKSETFNDRSSRNDNNSSLTPSPGSGKLRKEPSLSQDDLNRRVEAFIKKFNEEMRLQRQESLNQYNEMIGRGAH